MIAFFKPEALFAKKKALKEISHEYLGSVENKNNKNGAVIVFAHHRDVKVALDELNHAGFSYDNLLLIARKAQRYIDYSGLTTYNWFDPQKFDFDLISQKLFLRLFSKGKYLVLISGSDCDVNAATKIMSCRRDRAKVWRIRHFVDKD